MCVLTIPIVESSTLFDCTQVNSFARDIAGTDTSQSSTLLYLMAVGAIARRLIPSVVADRFFGSLNAYIFLTAITGTIIFCWSVVGLVVQFHGLGCFLWFLALESRVSSPQPLQV